MLCCMIDLVQSTSIFLDRCTDAEHSVFSPAEYFASGHYWTVSVLSFPSVCLTAHEYTSGRYLLLYTIKTKTIEHDRSSVGQVWFFYAPNALFGQTYSDSVKCCSVFTMPTIKHATQSQQSTVCHFRVLRLPDAIKCVISNHQAPFDLTVPFAWTVYACIWRVRNVWLWLLWDEGEK